MVGLDPERPLRDLGRDRGIAVAIPADPRSPADECTHPRRSGARAAGIGRFSAGRCRDGIVKGRVRGAEEARHRPEQRLVEEGERRPDLVEGRRSDGAQIRRPPQQRDLLAEASPYVAVLGWRQVTIVEVGEQPVDPAEGEQAASAGGPRSGEPSGPA